MNKKILILPTNTICGIQESEYIRDLYDSVTITIYRNGKKILTRSEKIKKILNG